jgi:hypothetical protein
VPKDLTSDDPAAGNFSAVADRQLDELEAGSDIDLYNAVLDTCDLIFRLPGHARGRSSAITTVDGILFRLPVRGHFPYKVFWSAQGPRIEAIFPHP